jgi:hypothetical protein
MYIKTEDPDLPAYYYDPLIHPIPAYKSRRTAVRPEEEEVGYRAVTTRILTFPRAAACHDVGLRQCCRQSSVHNFIPSIIRLSCMAAGRRR